MGQHQHPVRWDTIGNPFVQKIGFRDNLKESVVFLKSYGEFLYTFP